jgi:RNA polymerase sigma-70 factor (ECF subfamily)
MTTMTSDQMAELYRKHGWYVVKRGRFLLGNASDADEVCHEVFLRLAMARPSFTAENPPTAWFFRVTTNLCIDRIRAQKRHARYHPEQVSEAGKIEERALLQRDLVLRILGQLTPREQQLAIYRYIDEMTLEEMEQVCQLTRKTISKCLQRLKERAIKIAAREGFHHEKEHACAEQFT